MANKHIEVSCKNIFKHTDKNEINKIFTEKWVRIIGFIEQNSQYIQHEPKEDIDKPTKNNV